LYFELGTLVFVFDVATRINAEGWQTRSVQSTKHKAPSTKHQAPSTKYKAQKFKERSQ
jgi:hypothetical protein